MKKIRIYGCMLLTLLVALATNGAMGQASDRKTEITGSVVDKSGSPILGAYVTIKGTSLGTSTGKDGKFAIKVTQGDILVVSFIGYTTKNVAYLPSRTNYRVVLEESATDMEEVIVLGYGTVQRSDFTGSASSMGSDQLMKTGAMTFGQAMQGRLAGVKITTQSGEAGAGVDITIRGMNSLNAGTSPLYVIDGMQIDVNEGEVASSSVGGQTTYNPLASINPSDIASIDVLKDASATAIYGARGANGVIVITTKSGSGSMKTDVNFNAYFGLMNITKSYDMLDGQGYIDYKFARGGGDMEIWGKDYEDGNGRVPRNVEKDGLTTYNWQDAMTQTGAMQNYDISVNSVINKTRISASLGFYDQKGTIVGNGFQRYSGRLKLDHEINKKVTVGISTTLGRVDNKGAISSGGTSGTGGYTGIVQMMYTERPVVLYTPSESTGEFADGYVPLSSMTTSETYKRSLSDRILANAYAQYKPINDLTLRLSGSLSNTNSKLSEFYSSKSRWGSGVNGRSALENVSSLGYTLTATAEYKKRFNKSHNFTALVGAEMNGYHYEKMFVRVDNYDDQSTGVFDINKGQSVQNYTSNVYQVNRASVFARATYDYRSKYYATVNMRIDGSSNFAKSARVGYFPSLALAWKVTSEKFMKDVKVINNLKLRASAGITGNDRITQYAYLSTLTSTYYASNDALNFGLAIGSPDNAKLKWETTYQYNAGVDIELFKGRIAVTGDIYLKDTRDMLYNANIPSQSGFSKTWRNLGRMTNKGVEITLNTRNIVKKDFEWSSTLNFDTNKTQLISLGGGERYFPVSLSYGAFTDVGRVIVGEPIGLVYGYIWDGNYQISDFNWTDKTTGTKVSHEFVNSSNMSKYSYSLKDGVTSFKGVTVAPGDRKYKDITGDTTIDPNDRTIIGDTNPKFNFGFNNEFRFRNIDLSIFLEGSYGGKILNAFRRMVEPGLNNTTNNQLQVAWDNRWTPENGSNTYARILNTLDNQVSTYYVEDGSYLRIKNINVGYTFRGSKLQKAKIGSIRVYALIDNVYTFTNYSGLDPEVRSYEKFLRGMDQTAYPRSRNYMFGINMTF